MSCFMLNGNECLAIIKCNTTLKELATEEKIEVIGGEIVKITKLANFGDCFVKLYSCDNKALTLSSATYSCDYNVLKILCESFSLMLISIPDRAKRLMICSSNETENFLKQLKLNDVVKVNRAVLKRDEDAVCIVKYIGAVPQIGPGTYIGFVLFDDKDSINDKNNLARQYFNCNKQNGFIRNCGCFFTRKFLLEQDTTKLVATVKKSEPVVISESLLAKPHHPTKPSAPPIPVEPTVQPVSNYPSVTTNQTLYPSPLAPVVINKTATYPRQKYIAGPILEPLSPYNPNLTIGQNAPLAWQTTAAPYNPNLTIGQNAPLPWQTTTAYPRQQSASYPRQQYITGPSPGPSSPYNPNFTIGQSSSEKPRENLAMSPTNTLADRYRTLNPDTKKITIRHSIREGPKSSAKRIIFEEKVTQKYSGNKKKKQCCIIM